ncbi:MAG: hypothetical protein IT385_01775 [Deltaproteobacteria bacterium]|nr:hypothetical protein [Deltaproteobacteria bacterium]
MSAVPRCLAPLLLAACASAPSAGDLAPRHAFGGELRIPIATLREDLLVPQAHTGSGLGLALRYAGAVGDGALRLELGVGARYLRAQHDAQALAFYHGLRARYGVTLQSGAWALRLGPALGWETDVAYLETWDDGHAYWVTDRWLGVAGEAATRLSRCWALSLEVELALVAIQSRLPRTPTHQQDELDAFAFWFSAPQRDPRFTWIGETQRARISAELWRSDSKTAVLAGWGLGADVRLVHASWPASLVILELGLRFMTAWGFP